MFNRRHFTSLLGSLAATGSMAGSGLRPTTLSSGCIGRGRGLAAGRGLNRLSSPAASACASALARAPTVQAPADLDAHPPAKPELFLFMGDNFYADARTEEALKARYEEFRAVSALQPSATMCLTWPPGMTMISATTTWACDYALEGAVATALLRRVERAAAVIAPFAPGHLPGLLAELGRPAACRC